MVAIYLIVLMFSTNFIAGSTSLFVLFGFIAARMMPSLVRISNVWSSINGSTHLLETIREIDEDDIPYYIENESIEPLVFSREIKIDNISFTFADGVNLLDKFSLSIKKGEIIGFKGESGVGKSTLFNILLGLYQANEGRVLIDDIPLERDNITAWHKIVGYAEQETFISNDSLAYNVAMISEADRDKVLRLLNCVGLKELVASIPDGIDAPMNEMGTNLSGGEKQRIGIARALYKSAEVLFFDETTSALDAKNEENIISLLHTLARENNLTVLIISHRESSLNLCDRVITM